MALIANNIVIKEGLDRVKKTLPTGRSFNDIRSNKEVKAKKTKKVSAYQNDMTTVHK